MNTRDSSALLASSFVEHFSLYPRDMGQIMTQYRLRELSLQFTQGRWFYHRWGLPPTQAPASGVQLAARFENKSRCVSPTLFLLPTLWTSVDQQWKSLMHTLSGKFCASLNFVDETRTTVSKLLQPQDDSLPFRQGYLPKETVCTENLTPWIKLLPCTSKVGQRSVFSLICGLRLVLRVS